MRVFQEMVDHAFLRAVEIDLEPVIDAGGKQGTAFEPGAAGMVDVFTGAFLQKPFGIARCERRRLQVGTADAGAIDRIMHPVVPPDRPQDAVLDVIQGDLFSFDPDELRIPGTVAEPAGRDIDILDTG